MFHERAMIADEHDEQRRRSGQFAQGNEFAVGIGQPEIRRNGSERQHGGWSSSHAKMCADQTAKSSAQPALSPTKLLRDLTLRKKNSGRTVLRLQISVRLIPRFIPRQTCGSVVTKSFPNFYGQRRKSP
jgi:hypothetical protein